MRFAKVIVVNPPSPPGYVANRDSMGGFGQLFPEGVTILPPLDVPYLVGYLVDKKVPVEVLEAQGLDLTPEQLAGRIREIAGSNGTERMLVAVRTSAPTLDWDLSVCAAMKDASQNITVAIYGPVVHTSSGASRGNPTSTTSCGVSRTTPCASLPAGTPRRKSLG